MDQLKDVIVYDAECPFCRRQIERIRKRDRADCFEYVPRQQPGLIDRFPALARADFNTGMRLIERAGTVSVGADAVYQIARRLPYWRRWAWLYRLPGLHALAQRVYGWIAANRQRLGQSCEDGACKLPTQDVRPYGNRTTRDDSPKPMTAD